MTTSRPAPGPKTNDFPDLMHAAETLLASGLPTALRTLATVIEARERQAADEGAVESGAPAVREVMTLPEAADWLRVDPRTVRRLCQTGELAYFRITDSAAAPRYTTVDDLRAFVARKRTETMHQPEKE